MLREDDATRDGARSTTELAEAREARLAPRAELLLAMWPDMQKAYAGDEYGEDPRQGDPHRL